MRTLFAVFSYLWIIWGSLQAGATVFLWLHSWDVTVAYGVSLLGMTPIFGTIAASLMAPEVWDMSVPFALCEFGGGYVLFIAVSALEARSKQTADG